MVDSPSCNLKLVEPFQILQHSLGHSGPDPHDVIFPPLSSKNYCKSKEDDDDDEEEEEQQEEEEKDNNNDNNGNDNNIHPTSFIQHHSSNIHQYPASNRNISNLFPAFLPKCLINLSSRKARMALVPLKAPTWPTPLLSSMMSLVTMGSTCSSKMCEESLLCCHCCAQKRRKFNKENVIRYVPAANGMMVSKSTGNHVRM